MIVSIARRVIVHAVSFAAVFWLVLVGVAREAAADEGDPPEVEARRLVHILGYVAADYGGAVNAGAVTNPAEYEEQLSLLKDAGKIAASVQVPPSVSGGVRHAAERTRTLRCPRIRAGWRCI